MTTERQMTWDEVVAKMVVYRNERDALKAELSALRSGGGEAVAWMMADAMDSFKRGNIVEVSREKEESDDIPLYTHQQPSAVPVVTQLVEALENVQGCFSAAGVEGLQTVVSESTDTRLKDLVERRLLYSLVGLYDTLTTGQQWLKENT